MTEAVTTNKQNTMTTSFRINNMDLDGVIGVIAQADVNLEGAICVLYLRKPDSDETVGITVIANPNDKTVSVKPYTPEDEEPTESQIKILSELQNLFE